MYASAENARSGSMSVGGINIRYLNVNSDWCPRVPPFSYRFITWVITLYLGIIVLVKQYVFGDSG